MPCFKPGTVYPAQLSIRLGEGRAGGAVGMPPKRARQVSGTAKRQEADRESRVNRKKRGHVANGFLQKSW